MTCEILDPRTVPLDGATLVEASAGTGKTYVLTSLFLRLLLEKRLPVDQILVVTFTEAATEELRGRIRKRLAEAARVLEGGETDDPFLAWLRETYGDTDAAALLRGALRNFDLARIFTIHGFCRHTLTRGGFEAGNLFDTKLEPDLSGLVRQACLDFWRRRVLPLEGMTGAFVRGSVTVKRLTELASLPFLAQGPRLEPQDPAPDVREAEEAFTMLAERLAALWPASREAVRAELFGHTALKANMSRPDQLEERLAVLDVYAALPVLKLSAKLKELTPEYMASMTRKGAKPPDHPVFHLVGELLQRGRELMPLREQFCACLCRDFLAGLDEDLERRKAERNIQGFDDLIRAMRRAVDDDGFVRAAPYRAALIDEFQDTDGLQYAIFSTLFRDLPLFLIGDPKQAIYSFRGADLHTYLRAGKSCSRKVALGTNHRSTPELIRAVNRIFERPENPFLNPDIAYAPVRWPDGPRARPLIEDGRETLALTIWVPRGEKPLSQAEAQPLICRAVAAEISRLLRAAEQERALLGDSPLRAADMAVLVETNRQGDLVHQALRTCGVHSVLHQPASVFDTPEALEILALLRALSESRGQTVLRTALSTVLMGLDAADLRLLDAEPRLLEEWEDRMSRWRELAGKQGVMAAMTRMLGETGVRPRLLGLPGGERRMTNVLHCLEILHARERETRASLPSLTRWFARQTALPLTEGSQLRLDSDRDAVHIVTIHRSKGLEYPVVFCPFLYGQAKTGDGQILTHERGLVLDLGSEEFSRRRESALLEARAELIRLTYVALTRAASRCYMVWGRFKTAETSGPAWLFHGHRTVGNEAPGWRTISEQDMLEDLCALSGPEIEVADLPQTEARPVSRQAGPEDDLAPRPWTRHLPPSFALTSFSGLTRSPGPAPPPGLDDTDAEDVFEEADADDPMAGFPRGATAGSCLHRVFELMDFSRPESVAPAVDQALDQFGIDPVWKPAVEDMAVRVLDADLGGFRLSGMAERLVELEFLFPLRPVTRDDLLRVYRRHTPEQPRELAVHMERLHFEPRQGFMTGFVDLAVRHEGRFYLVDWKSNWLGPTARHYTPQTMRQTMTEHHYFLQCHLYCLALDRYLSLRMPGYRYEEHFGGARYVFLRGVDPARPGQGVYADRPEPEFLAALGDALFDDPVES